MKRINLLAGTLVITLIIFSSCNSIDKKAPLVPRDAAFVMHVNTNSLSSKLSWDDIKKSNWFSEVSMHHKDSLLQRILDDPSNSGMDTKEGFFVFAKQNPNSMGYLAFTGYVKDANTFEAFNKKAGDVKEVTNKDNFKTIVFDKSGSVSWNENKFIYLMQTELMPH